MNFPATQAVSEFAEVFLCLKIKEMDSVRNTD